MSKVVREPALLDLDRAPQGRALATDASGVEDLFRQHGATVGRWVLRLGGPAWEAEDTVQEVFAIVADRLPRFRGEASVRTWLFGITENVVRQQRRRARVRRWFTVQDDSQRDQVPDSSLLPLERLEQQQAAELVYRVLDRMREPYRSALILFELEGLSGEEIAELKRARVQTVWVWLHRARRHFAEQLAGLAGEGR